MADRSQPARRPRAHTGPTRAALERCFVRRPGRTRGLDARKSHPAVVLWTTSGSASPRPGLRSVTRQELSELREGHVLRDETRTATGEAVLRPLSNDAPARGYRLDVAPAAALLARRLNGAR